MFSATVLSDQTYTILWTMPPNTKWYEYEEGRDALFKQWQGDCKKGGTIGNSTDFHHEVSQTTTYYYRVKDIAECPSLTHEAHPWSEWSNVVFVTINPRTQ